MNRTYKNLLFLKTFKERFEYLKLEGTVGADIYGKNRFLNQAFYASYEWRRIRDEVILRDQGFDLGCDGYEIGGKILVHHMNPITIEDLIHEDPKIVDPNFLISTSIRTHQAIHYGDAKALPRLPFERMKGDTKLW